MFHFIGIYIQCGGIEDKVKWNKLHVGHKLKSTSNIINIGDLVICYNVNLVELYEYIVKLFLKLYTHGIKGEKKIHWGLLKVNSP